MKHLYKYFPIPSDKMGYFWSISSIKEACIIEYGPGGTTHYAIEGIHKINGELVSNMFTTDMNQDDVVMGDISRLKKSILEVDQVYKPKYIFVLASSLSSIIGSDIEGLVYELGSEVKAKIITYTSGGFKGDYLYGIKESYLHIARDIVKPSEVKTESFNIIGSGIFEYNYKANIKHLVHVIESSLPIKFNTSFTNGTTINELESFSKAKLNIVINWAGIKCAEYLKDKYDIKFIYTNPIGYKSTFNMINEISQMLNIKINEEYLAIMKEESKYVTMQIKYMQRSTKNKDFVVGGDYSTIKGYVSFLEEELGFNVKSMLINHAKYDIEETDERYIFSASEADKYKQIEINRPSIVLGDGVLIEIAKHASIKNGFKLNTIQVQNPNTTKRIFTDHKPLICFKGASDIIEKILNCNV